MHTGSFPRWTRLSALIGLFGAISCGVDGATAVNLRAIDVAASEQPPYQSCPIPQNACSLFHPGSKATHSCAFGACFEMNLGDTVRTVAADELGPYPGLWFLWTEATVLGSPSCVLTSQGKTKVRIAFPDGIYRCRVDVETDDYFFFEHYASNPYTGCLGWVECRLPKVAPQP